MLVLSVSHHTISTCSSEIHTLFTIHRFLLLVGSVLVSLLDSALKLMKRTGLSPSLRRYIYLICCISTLGELRILMKNCSSPSITPTMFCTASCLNPKPFSITWVNTHTTLHYLQMSVRSSNKTLSIECYSVTSTTVSGNFDRETNPHAHPMDFAHEIHIRRSGFWLAPSHP